MQKSFTLIELLVVTSIILLLTGLALPNYRAGQRQLALQRSAHKLAQDLRRVQEMAASLKEYSCPADYQLKGYGIKFAYISFPERYQLVAKCETSELSATPLIENFYLEEGVRIKQTKKDGSAALTLSVFFYPPDPTTDFEGGSKAEIILRLTADQTQTKTVEINQAGLINVE